MLSFADVDISPLTPKLSQILDRYWCTNRHELWNRPGYLQSGIRHLPIPCLPEVEDVKYNTLYWPSGASRWATFFGIVGGTQKTAILDAVNSDAPIAQTLLISQQDQNGDVVSSISPDMYLLGFEPLFIQGEDGRNLWLMLLVDERYTWWLEQNTYTYPSSNTWTNLLTNLWNGVNSTGSLTVATANSAYSTPQSTRWNINAPLPLLIDAAAMTVGLRFIRKLNGDSAYVNVTTANAADAARFTANQSELVLGGYIDVEDICGNIPETVACAFWAPSSAPTIATKTLAALSLPDYGTITGVPDTTAWIAADMPSSASGTGRTNYTAQAATDYYEWLLALTDATFRGILAVDVCGQEDRVEWEYMPGIPCNAEEDKLTANPVNAAMPWERVLTRIVRNDWADNNQYGGAPPSTGGISVQGINGASPIFVSNVAIEQFDQDDGFVVTTPIAGTARIDLNLTVQDVDGSPSYFPWKILQFDQADGFVITNPGAGIVRIDLPYQLTVTLIGGSGIVVSNVNNLEFNTDGGAVGITNPSTGVALVDIKDATNSNSGIINTTTQAIRGQKIFTSTGSGGSATIFVQNLSSPYNAIYADGQVTVNGGSHNGTILLINDNFGPGSLNGSGLVMGTAAAYTDMRDKQLLIWGGIGNLGAQPGWVVIGGVLSLGLGVADAAVLTSFGGPSIGGLYVSSTNGKLSYKDGAGTVHPLYGGVTGSFP